MWLPRLTSHSTAKPSVSRETLKCIDRPVDQPYTLHMSLEDQLASEIDRLKTHDLWRTPRRVSGAQGPEMDVDGKRVLCFTSNNYLGLANHPLLIEASMAAVRSQGLGAGASRLISGTMDAHHALENQLASFLILPSAILFSTGYAANVGMLQALAASDDLILSDQLNHASLIDGARLSRAQVKVYNHRDCDHVRVLLSEHRARSRRAFIVTDTLFSMDGDRAPVSKLRALADEFDASLVVDEAHALGVLGPKGRGICAEQNVVPDVLVGTLGKAFGVAGAFVGGSLNLVQYLRNCARSFVFSTSPPPSIAAAASAAIPLIEGADDRRKSLLGHAQKLRNALRDLGYKIVDANSQIIAVMIGDPSKTMQLSQSLFDRNIFAHGIRPPTVAKGTSRIRLVPMATHTDAQIEKVIATFAELTNT